MRRRATQCDAPTGDIASCGKYGARQIRATQCQSAYGDQTTTSTRGLFAHLVNNSSALEEMSVPVTDFEFHDQSRTRDVMTFKIIQIHEPPVFLFRFL